ncbi:MAG: APC family permease [Proteobacteria bacterium]|jgi:amino acid transporter|nr:APC family permease [Pseudomonadota bacterium]
MEQKAKVTHRISLFSATALSATSMVGAGWLFSAQLNAQIAGNYSFLAWVLAAMLVMAVGLCLSQVVSVYPVRGATTRSSALSHNNVFGMPFAFANWFGIMVVIATEAQATTQYLSAALHNNSLMNSTGLSTYGKLFALCILFMYLVINFYGIKLLAKVNNIVTVLKIFTPLFTISLFLIAKFDTSNFTLPTNNMYGVGSAITAIISAGLIYSYNGFQISVAFASEIKNPKRNVPLSIILSVIIVMVVYMLLQLSFMAAMPHSQLQNGWSGLNFHSPLINLAMLLGLNFIAILLVADSTISPSGTGFAYLGAASRMFYSMAAAGQMPKWVITRLHPKYFFCRRSLLINWVLASLVLWNSTSWASLMVVVTGYHIIGYMAAPISMGAIKPKTRPLGIIVFVLLGLIMTTIPNADTFMMNISLVLLMVIFGIIQITNGTKISTLLKLIAPFIIYLWVIYLYQNLIFVGIVSAIFYALITSNTYVSFCKKHRNTSMEIDDETAAALESVH